MSEPTSEEQFTDTPTGWAARFKTEFASARKALEPWHKEAREALDAYLGKGKKCGIYTADSQTQEAMLYGELPQVGVSRRFADAKDDVARVGAEIQERILNSDIETREDGFARSLAHVTHDRQHAGFGLARVRYERGEPVVSEAQPAQLGPPDPMTGVAPELAPAVPATQTFPNEQAETDYVHWQDFLYPVCRTWEEVPWIAFGNDLSPKDVERRFGPEVAKALPVPGKSKEDGKAPTPWTRFRVWEVWVKEERQVFFFCEGYDSVLVPVGVAAGENGGIPDPLKLKKFWPCPEPIIANTDTRQLLPKPDYALYKTRYESIDTLDERIDMLEEAVRVVGAYDKSNTALATMLSGDSMRMIPVDNWAMLAEKGGIKGVVDWFPLEQVVNALSVLRDMRAEKVDSLRQLTGMADIMRGQASEVGTTATADRITARFASVRMQKRQKELARFATDLQQLRAEVMALHFDESTYLARCNCENTNDAQVAPQAVKLLKSEFSKYRIEVKPEAISMTDFDALKQERTEVIVAISQFMQGVQPIVQALPAALPMVLGILQWMVAGIRGGGDIESLLDAAIAKANEAAQQPQQAQPDPKLAQISAKSQADMQKADKDLQNDIVRAQVEVVAERQKQAAQSEFNIAEAKAKQALTPPKPQTNGAPRDG